MKKTILLFLMPLIFLQYGSAQTNSEIQRQNARATGYAIVAARNPGLSFSINVIPWDGVNTLEYNANNQINPGWHAQAAIKGNFFNQTFDGSDFSRYSSVVTGQEEFDQYKSTGTQWWIVCSTLPLFSNRSISANANGNVGIGISTPAEKLSVNGKVRAHEVKVETANWPDYVFTENYDLPKLSDVEKHIAKKGHLPDIPSAATVKEEGINLGEMNAKLLKKIEELTLYIIDLKKEVNELKAGDRYERTRATGARQRRR